MGAEYVAENLSRQVFWDRKVFVSYDKGWSNGQYKSCRETNNNRKLNQDICNKFIFLSIAYCDFFCHQYEDILFLFIDDYIVLFVTREFTFTQSLISINQWFI